MKLTDYLPLDKAYHVIAGVVIFATTHWLLGIWSLFVVLIVAILKEAYDKYTVKGTPELLDIVYTMVGGLLGLIIAVG
jgi:hypothetical protein